MSIIYDFRQYLKYVFIIVAVFIAIVSVVTSNSLIKKLAEEERQKMEVWSMATRAFMDDDISPAEADQEVRQKQERRMELYSSIITGNTSIPVIICDEEGNIQQHRNVNTPEKDEDAFMKKKVKEYSTKNPPITIEIGENYRQYLYYDDSIILKRLLIYPYAELIVMFVFI
ncbi:MAG: ATP-binding protein, partial [Tannerella sp.]|nr:ATP-binding protein [Tannerella sp.]